MRKLLTLVVTALMIMTFAVAANAADISVTLNGEALVFEQAPVIVEGRTLVPLRAIFEALGASVEWDDATKTVTSTKDDITVKLTIGSNVLYKNDEAVELDVPAQIVGAGYTMVPARAIAESFGVLVDWDDSTKTVILVKEETVDVTAPTVAEGTVLKIDAEHYTDDIGLYGLNNDGPQIVDNPDNPGDKVFLFEVNAEGNKYNYLWYDCEWVPGERYLVQFRAKTGNDCYGNPVSRAGLGANVKIGPDKSIGSIDLTGKWTRYNSVYTVPADADTTQAMKFGVFASPVKVDGFDTNLGWSFYIDDISIVPYKGGNEDGMQDPNLVPQNLAVGFDINKVKGIEADLSTMTGAYGAYEEAGYRFTKPAKDPLAYIGGVNLDAEKYSAVAVKFQMSGIEITAASRDVFQIYFNTDSDASYSDANSVSVYYPALNQLADGSYIAYFDFANKDAWTGTIANLRLDPANNEAGSWLIEKVVFIEE